jgi:hypothetical protein
MATFTDVKITNISGTTGTASATGDIGGVGDDEFISRWMTGKAAPHITGTLTTVSGDHASGWRHRALIAIAPWDTSDAGDWSDGSRFFTSNYRTTAGALVFDFAIPTTLLAAGTKYRVGIWVAKGDPSITSPYQSGWVTYGPTLQTSFWTNRTPDAPVITDPPTGVSIPYNAGVTSEFDFSWTFHDDDLVAGTTPALKDYYGYEVQYRATPTPLDPNPSWQNFTLDAYYSGYRHHTSWVLDDATEPGGWQFLLEMTNGNQNTIKMAAQPGEWVAPPTTPADRILGRIGVGTWQFRMRIFDRSDTTATTPAAVPAYGTSAWSNTITINITAAFLPPLPVYPINDVAVQKDVVRFEWVFRDPRTTGGTQIKRRLRIRKVGDAAWTEIIPLNAAITSWPTGLALAQGITVAPDGSAIFVPDFTTSTLHKYDAAGTPVASWSTTGVPRDVVRDSAGNLYVADYTNKLVRKYNSAGVAGITWSTVGNPSGLAIDSANNIYVADSTNLLVRKFSSTGVAGITFGTTNQPVNLAVDSAGNIYVCDAFAGLIRKYNSAGTAGITWAYTGVATIAIDSVNNIYATSGAEIVKKYSTTGTLLQTWNASEASITGLATNAAGNVYVTGITDDTVYVFDPPNIPADTGGEQFYEWISGTHGFTLQAGEQYEWQPRTVSSPGNFDSDFSGPSGFFWAIPLENSGPVFPDPVDTLPDPGLGCGDNRPYLYTRGGLERLGEITQTSLVRWGRTRDGISTATIRIVGWSQDCGELLKAMRCWMNEIVIYRDNGNGAKRVWEGPVTRITYATDYVEIEAQDVWAYVYRRILRQGFNDAYRRVGWKYGPGGVVLVQGQEYGLTPVTRRSATIVQNALAYDDPNLLAYLTVLEQPDDARQSRTVADFSTTAWQQVDDFAAKSGLDYTAIGRRMMLWDTHNPIGMLPEMRDDDFGTPPIVTEYGMQLANFYGVTNNAGVYGTADRLTSGLPKYYGWIEMLSSAYGESEEGAGTVTLTAAAQAALEEALTEQAERNIASRWPTPLIVRVPDNTTLNPELNISINHLVPGVFIPVRATGTLREVVQMQKLDSMQVSQTDSGESITVTLSPAPRSRDEDPDEGGV